MLFLPELQQIDPAHIPHVEIAQYDIDGFIDIPQRLVGVLGAEDQKAIPLEDLHEGTAFRLVVLNDQNSPSV